MCISILTFLLPNAFELMMKPTLAGKPGSTSAFEIQAGGYLGVWTAAVAWYIATAELLNSVYRSDGCSSTKGHHLGQPALLS